jgi:hypothetical protein
MFDRALEELLVTGGGSSATRWISLIQASPQAKSLQSLPESELSDLFGELGKALSRWLSGTTGRNELGAFFARIGKDYSVQGIPLSELSLSLALARKAIVRSLVEEGLFDNANALYAMFDASERVADFYALGNYYMTKGFLETTIERITADKTIDRRILVEFFKDDLFYRD